MQYNMDETHVLQINRYVTECNCFLRKININIIEEMNTPINANTIDMGAMIE
jgi:hypothetical protein